ncbi:MAG: tRNA glutamyl-Q(34) synthetase GluQRS [Planctomycetota bacterium]
MMATPTHYVGRLAPSPTGALHLGNARTFLIAWLRCRAAGGRMILRMEDLDHPKVKPGTAAAVYDDLRWMGLDWDVGADTDPAEYVQSQRRAHYRRAFDTLRAAGRIYPCTCSRQDIVAAQSAPHDGEELHYPGTCRDRWPDAAAAQDATGKPPAWRFRVDDEAVSVFDDAVCGPQCSRLTEWSGDFVVARGPDDPAYQLAVVVDDAAMQVSEVVRADDLLATTHRQLALYDALALQPPGSWCHVPLVVGPDGRRLAKRHGDTRVCTIRDAGTPPERLIGWLAWTLGVAARGDELTTSDLLDRFGQPDGLGAGTQTMPRERIVVQAADHQLLGIA